MNDRFLQDRVAEDGRLGLSRSEFGGGALATGYALAVQPASGIEPVNTSDMAVVAGEVRIPAGEVELPAYHAMPAREGRFPVVVVVQEIFGVHEYIRDVCRRLAHLGYFAIAPELYFRQGDVSRMPSVDEIITQVVSKVADAQVMSDLDHVVDWVGKTTKGDTGRLGMTGFCWGGRITWLYAEHNAHMKAAVAWYGRVAGQASAMTPWHPIDRVSDLKSPVLGLYGGADAGIPVETVERMRAAAHQSGKSVDLVIYLEAGHAFHADYRPSYSKGPAEDGWARMLAWFERYGVV